jgi:pimeloyl-ACP methyl ester carboxylesterase
MTATVTAISGAEKSTIVRSVPMALFGVTIRALGAVLPDLAASVLLRGFCTPRRGRHYIWPIEPELQPLQVEGETIALYRWGPSLNGKKVLLTHGWSGRSEQLGAFVEPLRGAGYAVYAFDQSAHGKSSGTTSNLPRFARTLKAVGAELGPFHAVIAHSLGCAATGFAIGDGLRTQRVVLMAPPAAPRHFITGYWRALGIADDVGERMTRLVETREGARLLDFDAQKLAPGLRVPALVVHDRQDREVAFAEGEQWARALPQGRLLATERLGHNRVLAADEVVEAVTRFVRD